MTATKINGFAAPYRSKTFQDQANAQTARNGLVSTTGPVSSGGGTVTIPRFVFVQNGLLIDTGADRTKVEPSLAAPYYLVVTAPTPSQLDDLVFTFAKTPRDLSTDDVIVSAFDGLEWRGPQLLSFDGVYKDIDQANIDFGRVGPFSGLQTTVVGPNYSNSPGVIVDPDGLRQALDVTETFPIVVTDPDYPRVDRVVYRKPADSPNRIGVREFLLGGTYATTPQSSHAATAFSNTGVHSQVRTLIASDNTAHLLSGTGYGNTFSIYYTKVSADRASTLVAAVALQATTEAGFSAAIDNSDNIHLVFVQNNHIYYRKFDSTGTALTAAILIDPLGTPSTAPSVFIDPASTKVFVAYQSLLGASNNQIFFTTRDLSGNLITAAHNITVNASNLQNPSIFVTDDLLAYVAWEDTTFKKIYYGTYDDIGVAVDTVAYVSGAVTRLFNSTTLVDNASKPRMRVADNKSVFVTFLQDKGGSNFGVSIWNDGVAFMPTLLASGETFTTYSVYLDSTFNGLDIVVVRSTSVDYVKVVGETVPFTLNLSAGTSAAVATTRDGWGSMLHLWADPTAAGFQVAYQTAHIHDIGPAVVANGPNSYSLTSFQCMIQTSLFGGEQPVAGDQIVVTGSVAGNNSTKVISSVQTVTLVTANDYYLITVTVAFATTESPAPNPVLGAFSAPNGNAVNRLKSTAELTAAAFQLITAPTDILLARISMPGSLIVNYLPPGVTVALDSALFVPHGNNVAIDWGKTTVGNLTIVGGLQLLDMLHNSNYALVDVSAPMSEGDALYVVCDGAGFTPTPQVTSVATLPFSTPIIVLGIIKEGKFNPALLAVAAITQLDVGEEDIVGEDLPLSQRERLGILTETTYRAYGSTIVVNEGMDHAQAIGAIDSEVGAIQANVPGEATWTGDGTTTTFDLGTATIKGTLTAFLNDNTKPDVTLWIDGRKENLDSTGATGWRKISTTSIQFSAAPDSGSRIELRREGTSYGGPTPPVSGNLWSDTVDSDIVPPSDTYKVGTPAAPFAEVNANNALLKQLTLVTALGNCIAIKTKTNGDGTSLAPGYPASLYSDGKIYHGMATGITGAREVGFVLQAIAPGAQGPVLLFGPNIPGILTGLGFSPGDEVFIDETGNFTNGTTGLTNSGDVIARVGWADCPNGSASGVATDLIMSYQKILEVQNPMEDRVMTVMGQTDYDLPTLVLNADNAILDVQLWYDTGYQVLDASGTEGFKKINSTRIRLSEAPTDSGREMVFRKEGISVTTGGGGGSFDVANITQAPRPDAGNAGTLDLGTVTRPWSGIVMKDEVTNQVWRLTINNGGIQAVQIGTYP